MSEAPRSPVRTPARRTGLWVLGILVCGLLILAAYEYFVRADIGQRVEYAMLSAASERQEALRLPLRDLLSWLPNIIIAMAAIIFIVITLMKRRFLASAIAVGMFVGANVTTQLLKEVWLERPELANGVPYFTGNSMPSGHTTFAAAAAVAVFLVSGPRQRPAVGLLAALFATVVGSATFIETWHRPADMLTAYLVVAAWGLLAGWLIMRTGESWNTVTFENDTYPAMPAALCWFLGVVLTGAALLCFLIAGWGPIQNPGQDPSTWHWLAGILLAAGPGFLIAGAGISFFDAEAGRRHRGQPLPSAQRSQRSTEQVPPQFAHLYEV